MSLIKIINKSYEQNSKLIGKLFIEIASICKINYRDSILHTGSYGYVRCGYKNNMKVIVKIYCNDIFNYDFISEVGILQILSGFGLYPEILDIVITCNGNYVGVVMTDMGSILKGPGANLQLSNSVIMNIGFDFLTAYVYLYKDGIIHRDIKYNNVCLDNNSISIIDFGYALRAPYCSYNQEIITLNRNIDYSENNIDCNYIRTIDYLGIFNILYQLFGGDFSTKKYGSDDIVKKRLYFLLTTNSNSNSREKIISFLQKTNNKDYILLSSNDYYNSCQQESWKNEYQKVRANSGKFFIIMKKLLNINNKKRITVNQLTKLTEKIFSVNIYHKNQKIFEIEFEKMIYYNFPNNVCLYENLDNSIPIEVYAQIYYRFLQLTEIETIMNHRNLYYVIKHVIHCATYENISPKDIYASDMINYLKLTNGDVFKIKIGRAHV